MKRIKRRTIKKLDINFIVMQILLVKKLVLTKIAILKKKTYAK